MKKLILGLVTLCSLSAFAKIECYVNNKKGEHIDFNEASGYIDSGEPFGVVRVVKVKGQHYLSSIVNAEETISIFKSELSLTKQTPLGVAGGLGNIVCD